MPWTRCLAAMRSRPADGRGRSDRCVSRRAGARASCTASGTPADLEPRFARTCSTPPKPSSHGPLRGACAAERAVLRFGPAAETARQFNRPASSPQRAAAASAGAVGSQPLQLSLMATATVWAFGAGPAPSRSRQAPDHLAQRHRVHSAHRRALACAGTRDAPRSSLPAASRKRAAGARRQRAPDEPHSSPSRPERKRLDAPHRERAGTAHGR